MHVCCYGKGIHVNYSSLTKKETQHKVFHLSSRFISKIQIVLKFQDGTDKHTNIFLLNDLIKQIITTGEHALVAGKGLTSWLSFVVSSVSLSLSHWYPGSGVVLDCIDS